MAIKGVLTAISQVVGAVTGIAGFVQQRSGQKSAQAAADKSRRAQQQQQQLEQTRERRKQIREARSLRARALSAAVSQGVGTASTVTAGTTGGIQSQLSANLGFLSQSTTNVNAINAALGEQSAALSSAATGGALFNLGGTIFSNAEKIGSIFSPKSPTPTSSPTNITIPAP